LALHHERLLARLNQRLGEAGHQVKPAFAAELFEYAFGVAIGKQFGLAVDISY
jgi:hypothetical protein